MARLGEHVLAKRPSRADELGERSYRDTQRLDARDVALESAENDAKHALAFAISELCAACQADEGASPRLVLSAVRSALIRADVARIARRKASKRR
jgi:hypothetical protein